MTAPATVPAPALPFATHIPDRRPVFKPHRTLAWAKIAVVQKMRDDRARHPMTIYKLEDGEYRPLLEVRAGQHRSEIPELLPSPPSRSQLRMQIASLVEQEQYHLEQAEAAATRRRELEAAR